MTEKMYKTLFIDKVNVMVVYKISTSTLLEEGGEKIKKRERENHLCESIVMSKFCMQISLD